MYEIKAIYEGIVPMMMHRYADEAQTEKAKTKKAKGYNEADVLAALHHDERGVYVPADNIRMMLIGNKHRPGAAMIQGSEYESKKGTQYRNMVEALVWVLGPDDPMKIYIEPHRDTYDEVDGRSILNSLKSRSKLYRPIVNLPWSLSFIIHVTEDSLHESKVRQFFNVAGVRCGVCAYGPKFGRCLIKRWDVTGAGTKTESDKVSKEKKKTI